jgi:putative SOS response-associated peptidase YedK
MREPPRYDFRLEDLRAWHLVEAFCRHCRHRATVAHNCSCAAGRPTRGCSISSGLSAAGVAASGGRHHFLSGRGPAIDRPAGERAAADLTMCNDFGNNVPYDAYLRAFSQIRVPVVFPKAAPNLEPRDDIWPTEPAPVFRRREDGVEMAQLRWGFPPARPKGAPVINFRSEGRRFPKGRCLIPASHFFEFTGTKSPKSKWKFTRAGEDWFCFAGLWRPMPDGAGDAFTLLTTDPGPDVAPIHDRQMVVLDRSDWLAWLDLALPEPELLRPLPAGSLAVEQVR